MSITRPIGEQLLFNSSRTGIEVLDDYLEACEYGDRTLADLLGELFDSSGNLAAFDFRFNPTGTDYELQYRVGTGAWTEIVDFQGFYTDIQADVTAADNSATDAAASAAAALIAQLAAEAAQAAAESAAGSVTFPTLNDVNDVTITSVTTGQFIQWDGAEWVNITFDASDVETGTFADARISESSVTQHEAALTILPSQVTGLDLDGATFLEVNQSSHGFSVNDILTFTSGSYTEAQADSAVNAEVIGIVVEVIDANNFRIAQSGYVTTLTGLTADTLYFLSPTTAGLLTATEPSADGQISKPVLLADSTTSGWVFPYRGVAVSTEAVREKLVANRTYYVRSDGSDANDGLSNNSGGAFLTIGKALSVVAAIDMGGFVSTVQIGSGTWTENINLPRIIGGSAVLLGDTSTPSNVTLSVASGTCIQAFNGVFGWTVNGFRLTTTGTWGLLASGLCDISHSNMEFGACNLGQVYAASNSRIIANTNYTINGSAGHHSQAFDGGIYVCQSKTITITGAPAFSTAFAVCGRLGSQAWNASSFSGSATGSRYNVTGNAVLDSGGGGGTFFPGNSAGATGTGGVYL